MKKLALILLILLSFPSVGYHIVGGEIEFVTLEVGLYRINVVQYFDRAQTDNPGPEEALRLFIYRNSDDQLMTEVILNLFSDREVFYTNAECSIEQLQTSSPVWTAIVELDPQEYDDPEGYYIVWERCCRNAGVQNIVNPNGTGMKYVTEIPPLWRDDQPFINSSPQLFTPLSDYACVNQLYYIEFTGTDPDGDSLVYSLTTPLNSSASIAVPLPQPKPHPLVFFKEGYEVDNMVPGDPPLAISNRGLLTVNPSNPGLHVFSVLVEEYRDGEKIGHVQRDFQMLVIDGCEPPDPPVVGVKIPDDDDFDPFVDVLTYTLEEEKCFDYVVTNITDGETISLRAEGVNFEGDISEIFDFNVIFADNIRNDSIIVQVCAPGCPPVRDGPFIVDLIAGDDACPLPQLDTMRLMIEVEPPPNQLPVYNRDYAQQEIQEGDRIEFPIVATDSDGDPLDLIYYIPGIKEPEEYGFSLEKIKNEDGEVEATLVWDTNCSIYDFAQLQSFDVFVIAEDEDVCLWDNQDYAWYDLSVLLPPNTDPVVWIPEHGVHEISVSPRETVEFDVRVDDEDQDELILTMGGVDFNPFALGATFPVGTGEGTAISPFTWTASCDLLHDDRDSEFLFYFVGIDEDKCSVVNHDTLFFKVNVELPSNEAPVFERHSTYQLEVNTPFEIDLSASDDDGDELFLDFYTGFRKPNSESLIFEPAFGTGDVSSTLSWTPECSLLRGEKSVDYQLMFIVTDDKCPVTKYDTTIMNFEIVETRTNFDNFLPPNAFSPDGDGVNDIFTLSGMTDPRSNLPIDNCDDMFQYVSIHNRSGLRVFHSDVRDFVWDGGNEPADVYYYLVKYTQTEYNGYLQLFR